MSNPPLSEPLLTAATAPLLFRLQVIDNVDGSSRNEKHFLVLTEEELVHTATDSEIIEDGKDCPLTLLAFKSFADYTTGVICGDHVFPYRRPGQCDDRYRQGVTVHLSNAFSITHFVYRDRAIVFPTAEVITCLIASQSCYMAPGIVVLMDDWFRYQRSPAEAHMI